MNSKKKLNKYIRNKIIFSLLKWLVMFLPLCILTISKANSWFKIVEKKTTWQVPIGLIILSVFIVLIVLKKTKAMSNLWGFAMVFALTYLLRPIINDLYLISGCAFIGLFLSKVFPYIINYYDIRINELRNAITTGEAYKEIGIMNTSNSTIVESGR